MPRDLTPAMQASLEQEPRRHVVWFIRAAFSDGDVRLCTASEDIDWAGETWEAVGGTVKPGPIKEGGNTESEGLSIVLPSVSPILLQKLLTEHTIGRAIDVWKGHLDPETGQVVADPLVGFFGEMNDDWKSRVDVEKRTASIQGRAVTRIGSSAVTPILRMNAVSQGRIHPGDLFYEFVPVLATKQVRWAGKSTQPLRNRPPPDYPGDERGQYPNG